MWADNETSTDFLNFSETVDLIIEILCRDDLRPLSLGVFGGWGSGKSSLLKMAEQKLENNKDFILLTFDAWLFQDYDDARAALFESIGDALLKVAKDNESLLIKVKKFISRINIFRLLRIATDIGSYAFNLHAAGILCKGVLSLSDLLTSDSSQNKNKALDFNNNDPKIELQNILNSKSPSPFKELMAFRGDFTDLLNDLDKSLILIIDNLDRCLPKNAILTLEAARLFLFTPKSAFIIAADEEMIRHAVQEHYKTETKRLTTDYLDKLVQIPVRVPRPGVAEVRAYIIMLLITERGDTDINLIPKQVEDIRIALEQNLCEQWKQPGLPIDTILNAAEKSATLTTRAKERLKWTINLAIRMSPLLAGSYRVAGNPRIIKRLLNTIKMRVFVAKKRSMTLDELIIAKISLFERCAGEVATKDLYTKISMSNDGIINELRMLEMIEDKKDLKENLSKSWYDEIDFLLEWAKLAPKLSQVDLKPIAYLARETRPIYISYEGLSPETEEAIQALAKIKGASSPAGRTIIEKLPFSERLLAIRALIDKLSGESDWSNPPKGFYGALFIADTSEEAGSEFAFFLRNKLTKMPNWMKMALKRKKWWMEE